MLNKLRIIGWTAIIFSVPNLLMNLSRVAPKFVLAGMTLVYGLLLWAGIELLQQKRWAWWYLTVVSLLSTIMGLAALRTFSLSLIPTLVLTAVWIVLLVSLFAVPPSRWADLPTETDGN